MNFSAMKEYAKKIDELINNFHLNLNEEDFNLKSIRDKRREMQKLLQKMELEIKRQEYVIATSQQSLGEANALVQEVQEPINNYLVQQINRSNDTNETLYSSTNEEINVIEMDEDYLLNCSLPKIDFHRTKILDDDSLLVGPLPKLDKN